MKLETQFTVPNKDLQDLDYVNKVEVLEELLRVNFKITLLNKIIQFVVTNNF